MRACHLVEIQTPKRCVLNGIWLGPTSPRRVYIIVHGLTSSVFSRHALAETLVDTESAVLLFNNRGHDIVASVRRVNARGESLEPIMGGSAHEVFTECIDDLDGAVAMAGSQGAREIFLIGHSTGCQKAVYFASKRKSKGITGLILLAPLSDRAIAESEEDTRPLKRALTRARALIRAGKSHDLILPVPHGTSPSDAQRFVSLYGAGTAEDTFPYQDPQIVPRALRSLSCPILTLLASNDEHGTHSSAFIAAWFERVIRAPHTTTVIDGAGHSFRGSEEIMKKEIARFVSECYR